MFLKYADQIIMWRIFIIFLLISSCTTTQETVCLFGNYLCLMNSPKHDPFFNDFLIKIKNDINKFSVYSHIDYHKLPIYFSNKIDKDVEAACVSFYGSRHSIVFNNHLSDFQTRDQAFNRNYIDLILRHEIGHCYLNREHNYDLILLSKNVRKYYNKTKRYTSITKRYTPKSLMYPIAMFVQDYLSEKSYYDMELFSCVSEFEDKDIVDRKSGLKENNIEYLTLTEMTEYNVYDSTDKLIFTTNNYGEYHKFFY